jgi:hypothetical protein
MRSNLWICDLEIAQIYRTFLVDPDPDVSSARLSFGALLPKMAPVPHHADSPIVSDPTVDPHQTGKMRSTLPCFRELHAAVLAPSAPLSAKVHEQTLSSVEYE